MLIWMREGKGSKIIKYVLFSMLVMAVAGLVLTDVGGFFRTDMTSNVVVKGGGVNISSVEFDRTLRRVLAAQGMQSEEAYRLGLVDRVITSEIQNRFFQKETHALGLYVSDEALSAQIAKLAESLQSDGRSKKEALQQILRQQGISESEFVGSLRGEMANSILQNALSAPASLTSPLMAQSLYRYDNEKRAVRFIVLSQNSVKGLTKPTEENLRKYYDANKVGYLIPETRTITVATLKPSMLDKAENVSEAAIRAEYDKNIAMYTKSVRRLVDQSVLKTEAEAKKVAENIKAGKSLKESTPSDGYIGAQELEEEGLLPEIAKPVFKAKEGDVIGPIQTALGWHVLVVDKILAKTVTPYEQVKDKLATELKQIGQADAMYKAGNTIEDRIAAGDTLQALVDEYGMTTEKIGPFRDNGTDASGRDVFKSFGADRSKMLDAAFDYEEGELANIVETADGQFHVVRIDQTTPDSYRPFESVRTDLEKNWITEQRRVSNMAAAKMALESLNNGKSLEDIAMESGSAIREISGIGRKEAPPAPLTPLSAAQIFATKQGENFSAGIDNGYVVGKVTNIAQPQNVDKNDKEFGMLNDLVGRSLEQDILAQYISSLLKGKNIQINKRQLESMYGGNAQSGQPVRQ